MLRSKVYSTTRNRWP